MKNLLLVAFLASGVFLQAQRAHRTMNHDLSAEQIATLKAKKLTLALDLNTSQERKIQNLIEEKALLRMEQKQDRDKASLSSDEKYARQITRLDRAIEHKAQMKNILTKEQYAKWEKLQIKKGHRMKKARRQAEKRR